MTRDFSPTSTMTTMAPKGKTRPKTTTASSSKEASSGALTKVQKPRSKAKASGSGNREGVVGKEDDASTAIRKAWLPHFQRLVNNPRVSVDQVVLDVLKELDQINLTSQLGELEIEDSTTNASSPTKSQPDSSDALLHFLDCAIVSEVDSQESATRIFQLIAGVAVRTRTLRSVLSRALTFSATVMERVRSQSLLALQQIVVTLVSTTSTHDEQVQEQNEILDAISEALTLACTDKSKLVRHSAVTACQALLSLDSVEAEVLQSVIWVAQHDPIPHPGLEPHRRNGRGGGGSRPRRGTVRSRRRVEQAPAPRRLGRRAGCRRRAVRVHRTVRKLFLLLDSVFAKFRCDIDVSLLLVLL
jgi:hypothetical protein